MGDILDLTSYLRFAAALVAVLALILIAAHVAKRFLPGGVGPAKTSARRRLAISEILPVDARRRLLLVKRDGREHLILLGPGGDLIVERDIADTGADDASKPASTVPAPAGEAGPVGRVMRLFGETER